MPGPVEITRRDIEVSGGTLACFDLGHAAGDRIAVALHGITSTSRAWLPVARGLADRTRLVALDLRGRGHSRELPGPYGMDAHVRDVLAVLDALGLPRAVLVGHSLGAYIVARVGAQHPDRVRSLILVDGGLAIPGVENIDLDAFLGPALARLKLRFPDQEAYRAWWRQHPALADADVLDADLCAYSDYDLIGEPPNLRSTVVEDAVAGDAADLLKDGDSAHALELPARLLCAPRGLQNGPDPMQPLDLARAWAAEQPDRREALLVPDVNHYTITLGTRGAAAVADAIAATTAAHTSL